MILSIQFLIRPCTSMTFDFMVIMDQLNNKSHENWFIKNIEEITVSDAKNVSSNTLIL